MCKIDYIKQKHYLPTMTKIYLLIKKNNVESIRILSKSGALHNFFFCFFFILKIAYLQTSSITSILIYISKMIINKDDDIHKYKAFEEKKQKAKK